MALKLFLFLSLLVLVASQGPAPVVRVAHGILQGAWKESTKGRQYASFQGIPYARPPIGKYRFRDPQEMKHWAGVWDASKPSPRCIQYDPTGVGVSGSENCLYVNVATPNPHVGASLPVVVFVHGGAFMYGEGAIYTPDHFMDRDVVLVTFNYRLGPLGFLSTGDQAAPGNVGLKDQSLALHWVKSNIVMFGGNPDSITLTGDSAGSASVHYHYLSPLSRDTFHRGMAMSGSALASWTFVTKPLQKAKTLASIVGCPVANTRDMVDCLRYRPAEMIVNAQIEMFDWRVHLFTPFSPTAEPVGTKEPPFLTQYPYHVVLAGGMADVPLITSATTQEGLYPAAFYQRDPAILQDLEARWEHLASNIFEYNDTLPLNLRPSVAAKIKQHYLSGKPVSQETFPQLVQALGDRLFAMEVGRTAQLHSKSGQPTYFFQYGYRATSSFSNLLAENDINYGVSHADDIMLLFKFLPYAANSTEDNRMREILLDMVYSYASTGVPKVPHIDEWKPVQPDSPLLDYVAITNADNIQMKSCSDFAQRSFWDQLGLLEHERYQAPVKDEL